MKEQLNHYADKLQTDLDPTSETHQKLVQKGLLLFRQQLVYQKIISHHTITAKVQDVTPVHVTLDLEHPENNDCSCPYNGICRHQLALFFSVYSQFGSVFEWIQEWKKSDRTFDVLKNIKRGSDLLTEHSPVPLTGVDAWLSRFNKAYNEIHILNEYSLEDKLKTIYHRIIEFIPVEREWKPLYQLFAAYESIKVANQICVEHQFQTHQSFFSYMMQEVEDAIKKLSISVQPFAFDPYIAYLREDCFTLLEIDTYNGFELVELYIMLWTSLFKQSVWRRLEFERIQSLSNNLKNQRVMLAYIQLAILCGNDDIAINAIKNNEKNLIYFSQYWFNYLKTQKSYSRLYRYVNAIIPFVSSYLSKLNNDYDCFAFMRMFLRTIDETVMSEQNAVLLERVYIEFLPFSYAQYNEYLMLKHKHKTWVELQHFTGRDLESVDKWKLETIAKADPQLVMPLYHEAIENLLQSRTRDSYKKSVKFLKKLRTLYKRQKKLPNWDLYMNDLLLKTKRLRAFHEECRRGKLIDA
jgi:hypothetical protein